MFDGAWRGMPDTTFIDWPADCDGTLGGVARQLIDTYGVGAEDRLVGTSLGGIVALEIAALAGVTDVVLVASARMPEDINPLLLKLAPLSDITPLRFVQQLAGKGGGDLGDMFAAVDAAFIRGSCQALAAWRGTHLPDTLVRRIHGRSDHVIPPPADADLLLDGGHLIAMTHARECVAFLSR
jgi:pimeloyl-ACP methyl ester carboxylesterase